MNTLHKGDDNDDDDDNNNNNNSAVCENVCGRSFTVPRVLKFYLVIALGKKMQFSVAEKFSTM